MFGADAQQPIQRQTQNPISPADLPRLCRRALQSPDPVALQELRLHAKEILASLGDEEIQKALTVELADAVPVERIAVVYEVLAEAEPCPEMSTSTRETLLRENAAEEEEIGRAFKDDLLSQLERPLANLFFVFAAVPQVSRKEQRHLRRTPSVVGGWPRCAGLVACGLTPLGVFYASRAALALWKRLQESNPQQFSGPMVLSYVRGSSLARPEPTAKGELTELSHYLVREVLQVTRCGEQAAQTLVDWLIDVACFKPLLFAGARAERDNRGIRLVPDEDYAHTPLSERWREMTAAPTSTPAALRAAQPSGALSGS